MKAMTSQRVVAVYSKTCVKQPLSKRPKIGFQDQLSLNAGQKCCRMLQGEHSAILLAFIKLPFVIKIFVLSNFEWPFNTGCTVLSHTHNQTTNIITESIYILFFLNLSEIMLQVKQIKFNIELCLIIY